MDANQRSCPSCIPVQCPAEGDIPAAEKPPDEMELESKRNRSMGWEGWEDEVEDGLARSRMCDVLHVDNFNIGFHPPRAACTIVCSERRA